MQAASWFIIILNGCDFLNQELRCPFEHNCEVTQVTRRFCQRCRLKKCLTVGMKKESILSPQEKMVKKQKIEENRQRKQMMLAAASSGSTTALGHPAAAAGDSASEIPIGQSTNGGW